MATGLGSGFRTRVLAGALACLAASLVGALPASASTWTVRQLPGIASRVTMFGVSCPSTQLCVAVGGDNTVASSTDPSGGAGSWDVAYVGIGAAPEGPNWRQIRGVSCPSTQLCVAVSFEGLIYTSTDPTGGAAAWSVADLSGSGPSTHLYGVSCPSTSFCAASAGGGKIVTATDPTGGPAAWTTTQLAQPLELRGISCLSAAFCVAVGDRGGIRPEPTDEGAIVSSTAPLAGAGAWQQLGFGSFGGDLYGVSCPSSALCVSGNAIGKLPVSTDPTAGAGASWPATDGGGTVQITDADCLSPSRCVAVDNNADVLTSTDPSGGAGAWSFTNVVPYPGASGSTVGNAMFGVSCPSTSLCVASASYGQVFTSSDPFVETPAPGEEAAKAKNKSKKRKRPRRPRAEIARSPEPAIETRGSSVWVRFHFFAKGQAQVRGFECRLDARRARRCSSPKAFRAPLGHHVFRVRAIGWTGLKGPVASWRFQICHPTAGVGCQKHLPPPTPIG